MTKNKLWYVVLTRRWMARQDRWSVRCYATDERPYTTSDDLAVYAVEHATSANEAVGIAVQWLAQDRPRAMTVKEIII